MNRLKWELERQGVQVTKMCEALEINPAYVTYLTSGRCLKVLKILCQTLNIKGDPLEALREGTLTFEPGEKQ